MDQCWSSSGRVLNMHKVEDSKREAFKGRSAHLEWRRARRSTQNKSRCGRRLLGQNVRVVQRIQLAADAKQAGGVGERRRR